MAFLQVQTATQTTGAGAAINLTISATTAGNLVVVHVKTADQTETVTSVTDNKGNTYVVRPVLAVTTSYRLYQAYGMQLVGGATTITVNKSAALTTFRIGADEYSGFAAGATNSSVFDASQTGTGTGLSLASSTLTPSATGELIVATLGVATNQTFTAGANYTIYSGVNPISLRSEYRLLGAASETAPASIDGSNTWGVIATAFQTPAGAGAGAAFLQNFV